MGTLRYFSMLAALALAGAAYAQAQATPDQPGTQSNAPSSPSSQSHPGSQDTSPGSASSPHQRQVTSQQQTNESPPSENPDPSAASSPHQQNSMHMAEAGTARSVQPGMTVQAPSGESLGTVVDLVPGRTGSTESGYVVIATSGGSATPVPYAAASSMIQNGKIVVERTRLESAPKVQPSQLEDRSSKTWQSKADRYWGAHTSSGTGRSSSGPDRVRPDQNRPMDPNDSSNPPQR